MHTLPGTANAVGAVMNAYGSKIPLVLIAGRTPYTEEGNAASRNRMIHWTQETRDQGGIVRQWTKWDYEVRRAEQVPQAVSRAFQLATSEPCGPVYLMLPREVTVEKAGTAASRVRLGTYEPGPSPEALEEASKMINASRHPVIITWRAGRKRKWFDSLRAFADAKNVPVVNYAGEALNYPSSGKMALDRYDLKRTADLILVVECEVPWIPSRVGELPATTKVIKVDTDPGHQYIPFYSFPSDLSVASSVNHFFDALMDRVEPKDEEPISKLREEQQREKGREIRQWKRSKTRIHPRLLSHEIGKLGLTIVNEYPFDPNYCVLDRYGTYYANLSVGYLGWAMGAAVGLKMATGTDAVATVGDGAFMFGVPEAFYYLAHSCPVMVAIFDNGGWMSSSESAVDVYPTGLAAKKHKFPGTEFEQYELGATVKAFDGHFQMVERADQIAPALERGREELQKRKRISVLQFVVERTR